LFPPSSNCDYLTAYLPLHQQASYRSADEILPGLWLGNECAATDAAFLAQVGIRVVITMSEEHALHTNLPAHVTYYRFPLSDDENEGNDAFILQMLAGATAAIQRHHACQEEAVLVHCQMGISRSTSAIVYYLLKSHTYLTYVAAMRAIRAQRPAALPNVHFERLLRQVEDSLLRKK
jgi:predicted protein tyrosine phosphatase